VHGGARPCASRIIMYLGDYFNFIGLEEVDAYDVGDKK